MKVDFYQADSENSRCTETEINLFLFSDAGCLVIPALTAVFLTCCQIDS